MHLPGDQIPDDNTLLRGIAQGDQRAFAVLFERHWKVLYNKAVNLLEDPPPRKTWYKTVLSPCGRKAPIGYQIDVRIPWSVLRVKPGAAIQFHAVVNDITTTGQAYTEPLSGNESEKPYRWSSVKLVTSQNEHP